MKRKILVATTNKGKLTELRAMLDLDVEWVGLDDLGGFEEVIEDGSTFAANARKKALTYAAASGFWTLADDSGLVIDALEGAPGVHSARFSGDKADGEDRGLIDHRNIARVLELMKDISEDKRGARFVCSLCLANANKVLLETEGVCEGMIAGAEVGDNGFGYDPIFIVEQLGKTTAQLSSSRKNAISHRGNAIRKLKPMLAKLVADGVS
ncbi:MAG: RdgB/HAM1 family non-canonical purine NTP pyrophosphatase [Planctomycetes bacterium]|nr:RdgB/HAM1 family non-canonical purine NTP pyrophosphatase [Planctomycetota bacterium]